jgi:diguanylate cyclase (GGDEF)-like protein/PAS domain S-box-containing protein
MVDASKILAAKILIVDDQPANIQLLEMMLQRAGYLDVSSTTDPTAVAALYRENRHDLILLDLHMPGMSGFQVMEALTELEPSGYLPVLVITAQPSEKLRALTAGARDFISKPFDRSEVLTRIHNMLEVRLLHDESRVHGKLLEAQVAERTAELRQSEEMFRDLAANIPEALWIRDAAKHVIEYANPAWRNLTGLDAVRGDPAEALYQAIHRDDLHWVTHDRRKAPGAEASTEYRLVRPDQSVRWVRARTFPISNPMGDAAWVAEIMEDVTQRREAQRRLVHLAGHDALTDLPNRSRIYETLHDAMMSVEEQEKELSVLLLDVDYFKNVNDTLGHTVGDALLKEFAARLVKCVRPGDVVGRLGGDEFVILLRTPAAPCGAIEVAARTRAALQAPLVLEGQTVQVTASIGIASYPADATDLKTLMHHADTAMYEAKAAGRNTYRCYNAEMVARAREKSDIEGAMRLALGRGEFVLHYQPRVQIDSGRWTSVEALIRWNRPGHGLVYPGHFISSLEETGMIVPVGEWVIGDACRQIREWERAGLGGVRVAVNVSSRQIGEERFVCDVANMMQEYHVDPALLEFEITEGTLMAQGDAPDIALRKLKDLGISISIDDFGTGYSNLAYLKRFLVDALKIDIAFIRDVTTNADDATITVAIINMAHSLRLKVVAEGVETPEQFEFLRMHGCDEVQGYFLSRPLAPEEFAGRLRQAAVLAAGQEPVPRHFSRRPTHA